MKRVNAVLMGMFMLAAASLAQAADLVTVVSKPVSRTVDLPGELQPYLSVAVRARVRGFVERVLVDRGSEVKQGELLAELSAPEMTAQIAEAQAKAQAAESERAQAEAQLAGAQSTADRLAKAAQTPGAIAGNELVLAQKQVEAAKALLEARQQAAQAAEAAVKAQQDLEAYLRITAPFDGVVTERLVHPGAIAGPGEGTALMNIEQVSRLRLVVATPEQYTGSIARQARVQFAAPAFPGRTFEGTVARIAHSLDPQTRTMAVELDVANRDGSLAPGMYASVKWPVRNSTPQMLVPKTSVVTTTERTFVVRDRNGRAEWVNVVKGTADGDLVEVTGELHAGDKVVRRASDEIREGTTL